MVLSILIVISVCLIHDVLHIRMCWICRIEHDVRTLGSWLLLSSFTLRSEQETSSTVEYCIVVHLQGYWMAKFGGLWDCEGLEMKCSTSDIVELFRKELRYGVLIQSSWAQLNLIPRMLLIIGGDLHYSISLAVNSLWTASPRDKIVTTICGHRFYSTCQLKPSEDFIRCITGQMVNRTTALAPNVVWCPQLKLESIRIVTKMPSSVLIDPFLVSWRYPEQHCNFTPAIRCCNWSAVAVSIIFHNSYALWDCNGPPLVNKPQFDVDQFQGAGTGLCAPLLNCTQFE